jgi:hypothetical protein
MNHPPHSYQLKAQDLHCIDAFAGAQIPENFDIHSLPDRADFKPLIIAAV